MLNNRIPPPLVLLATLIAMWGIAAFTVRIDIDPYLRYGLAGFFFVVALAFAGPAVAAFRRAGTTINPVHIDQASMLVTSGVFAWTRNPMYVGMSWLLLAWAFCLSAPWSLAGLFFFVLFITRFQIMPEERAMERNFGAAYEDYKARVRRWL